MNTIYTAKDLRAELVKIMPGYDWTVHKQIGLKILDATGTQSSGFNRTSTLLVVRVDRDGAVSYEVKSSGYGLRAKWLHCTKNKTLASALRVLQDHYEDIARTYQSHANALVAGRKATGGAAS